MSEPRTNQPTAATYFFSVHLLDPRADTLIREIDVLRQAVRIARKRWPFVIDAAVVLPNQTHMIWTLPTGDLDYAKRWRLIKSVFSRHVDGPAHRSAAQIKRKDKGIWQRRFWDHRIRDGQDFDLHMELIRRAPADKGLVKHAADWPYSSFSRHRRPSKRTIDVA
ncbi:putative transposase [Cognatiyoonia koreensis]|uniref:Putative transposase n=1 Tax=Cognatiyoonia koreensis TaxID=364200 RepID=A0A1I0RAQ1_9RHOB|nr:hypothetical protein [Cognatiyoonia koreensis]SEW37861.1 putative transposase [Cognatiyoonia koreensis]